MDLLPVLRMLEKQDPTDVETWETRYVLLVWLSIISKIPFPLSRLEVSENIDPEQTIIVRYFILFLPFALRSHNTKYVYLVVTIIKNILI